jgi:AcrR family transcriptional regulator
MKVSEKQDNRRKEIALSVSKAMRQSKKYRITVDNVCKTAGIAKGTFYHYFCSKEDLLSQIMYTMPIDDLFPFFEKDIYKSASFIDAIILFTQNYAEHIMSNGLEMSHAVLLEMLSAENSRFLSYERKTIRILYNIIETWQLQGSLTKEYSVKQICDMFIVIIRGYLLNWYVCGGKYNLAEVMTLQARLFASSLLI